LFSDKRRLKRRNLILYLPIENMTDGSEFGRLVDVTREGLMSISPDQKEVGKIFSLKLSLPTTIGGEIELLLDGKAVWCRKDVNPEYYVTGIQFHDVSKKNTDVIELLIDYFAFK
jgi:hypothetical protein